MTFLSGYKTYIVSVLGVVLTGALAMGYIDQSQFTLIGGLLASLGLGFLRASVPTA